MKKILLSTALGALLSMQLIASDKVSSYENAAFASVNDTKSALRNSGAKIVGEYDAMQNPSYHVIVYTNDTLINGASKKDRAFAAVQKVLVNKADKTLTLTNPEYFLHAFLQDEYKEADAKQLNTALQKAFGALKGSADGLEEDDIEGYHFMMGMPYYEDMITVAEGKNLAQKLEKNAGENVIFKLAVGSATLYGVAMPTKNGEASYVPAIKGEKNTAFLPYMVMIQDDEAKILHAKYYLAISYPQLSMGEFMKISGAPGDIEDYFAGLFK